MTEATYKKIEVYFNSHKAAFIVLKAVYSYLPLLIYALYPVLLINNFIDILKGGDIEDLIRTLVVPAVTFLSVSLLRILINKPRPYEAMDINPIFKKDTKGKSFPSRHSASIFTIAMASFGFSTAVGTVLIILGVLMCISRVIGGVHYISDVIAGAVYSVILGIFGLYII